MYSLFTAADAKRIARAVRVVEQREPTNPVPRRHVVRTRSGAVALTLTEITASTATEPGSGTVEIVRRNRDTGEYEYTGVERTVYNMSTGAIAADTRIQIKHDIFGDWWADVVNCG